MSIIQAARYGFGMGAGSLISRRPGAGNEEDADRSGNSALTASFLVAMAFSIAGLLNPTSISKIY